MRRLGYLSILMILSIIIIANADWDPSMPLAWKGLEYEMGSEITGQFDYEPYFYIDNILDYPNIRVNSDQSGQIQNEEQIAVNPVNPSQVVAVWRDFRLGYRRIGVGYSTDGGLTWVDTLFEGTPHYRDSDPGLTYDSQGTFYAIVLSFESTYQPDGLFVFRSSDGGQNWDGPYTVVDGVSGAFEDKELIACDRSGSQYDGNLYVVWTRFVYGVWPVVAFCRSTDGGVTWSNPIQVDDNNCFQWPNCAVGSNGEVYVSWVGNSGIMFDKSTNGGVNFGSDKLVTNAIGLITINGGIDVFSYPAIDVDLSNGPNRGNIYIAFMDRQYNDTDIFFVKSTDGGNTWSQRVRINDDQVNNGRDQFHPWLYVDQSGVITVVWLDRRLDPGNLLMDCYFSRSTDAGETWSPNERITTESSDPTAGSRSGLIGEYIGVSGTVGRINPIWTDTRLGDQDAFVSVISFGPTPTPTPTFPPIPTATPTLTYTPTPTFTYTPTYTPLPTNTFTPTQMPTLTPTPTKTPTFYPTSTPLFSPTPTSVVTNTPTPITTNTPVQTFTPTETPTSPSPTTPPSPTPCTNVDVQLTISRNVFRPGDQFVLSYSVTNNCSESKTVDFYLILDFHGNYWFYPSWSQDIDNIVMDLAPGETVQDTPLDFIWPPNAGSARDVKFWAGVTNSGTYDVWDITYVSFDFYE